MPNIGPTSDRRSISASARPPFMRPSGRFLPAGSAVAVIGLHPFLTAWSGPPPLRPLGAAHPPPQAGRGDCGGIDRPPPPQVGEGWGGGWNSCITLLPEG